MKTSLISLYKIYFVNMTKVFNGVSNIHKRFKDALYFDSKLNY